MNIRQRLAHWLFKAADIGGWDVQPWQVGRPYAPDVSYKALVEKYQSWVYACTRVNAVTIAQVPLRLYVAKPTKGSKSFFDTKAIRPETVAYLKSSPHRKYIAQSEDVEEVLEHPFLKLLAKVNDFMNGFELMENLSSFQDLCGNAYWLIIRDNLLGVPSELWPLMPQNVKPVPHKTKFISHYEYKVGQEKHIIQVEDLIHFRPFNPRNTLYGMGPLEACVMAADLSINMNQYETSLMANRAQPDWALMYPVEAGSPGGDAVKRIKREWNKEYRGVKKVGRIGVLTGGAELKQLSLSPKEMNFLQGRKWTREEICNVYGVPISKFTSDNVNRANAEAGEYGYMKDTVLPRLRKIEQKLNEKLLPMFDERLFCAFENPVPQDKEFRLKERESNLRTGYSSINQELQKDGQEDVEWGEVPYLRMNLVPVGSVVASVAENTEKAHKSPRRVPPLNHPTNFIDDPFVKELQLYFGKIADDVLTNFDKDADAFKGITKDRADDFVSGWFNKGKWAKELDEVVRPHLAYTTEEGGKRAFESLDVRGEFDGANARTIDSLEKHRYGAVQSVNSNVVKRLRNGLAAGMAEGEGINELRKRVDGVFEGLSKYQASLIARTETIWAWNEGAVQGYIQSGVVEKKQWLSSNDPRSCDYCLSMDGKIVGVAEDYFDKGDSLTVAGSTLSFTYNDIGHPPIHPQCRCTIVPILVGE